MNDRAADWHLPDVELRRPHADARRNYVDIDTVPRLISGVAAVEYLSPEQRDRSLVVALNGLLPR